MDKNKKIFYTIIGAISALAAATAAFLALKKHRCAEQKLIEEIDDIVSEKSLRRLQRKNRRQKLQPMSLLRKNKQQIVAPNSGSSICMCKS